MGDLQPAPLQQAGVGRIAGFLHDRPADVAIEMAAMAVAAGIHHQRLSWAGTDGHGFMAEPAQSCVFDKRVLGPAGIDLHHPAVLVAHQAEGVAQALQPLAIEPERTLRRRRRTAIGVHRLDHLTLKVLFR